MKTFRYILSLILLIPLGALDSVSQEYLGLKNNSPLIVLADSSSQKSNLKQGLHKTYYTNGIIKEELFYKDGKLNGIVKRYDKSGFLKESLRYKNGFIDGPVRTYNRGKLTSEAIYQEGKYIKPDSQRDGHENIDLFSNDIQPQKKEGTVDLSTTEFKYLSYFAKLKRQIEKEWKYPKESGTRGEFGKVLLIFTLTKNGELKGTEIITSSGYSRLDNEAQRAIKSAAPYAPFPDSWGELEKLNIRAIFEYTGKPIF